MSPMRFFILASLIIPIFAECRETQRERQERTVLIVSSLGNPEKLKTLTSRGAGANRFVKICYWLHDSKTAGIDPVTVTAAAVESWGWGESAKGELTAATILHAFNELERFGCFELAEDRENLKRGARPIIRRGTHTGESVEMDHIVPVALAPEWTQLLANLEPLPQSVNRSKGDAFDERVSRHRLRLIEAGF
jgi:hypothetical protein